MTSFSAKHADRPTLPLEVVFVVYPDIVLLDLAGPLQVFAGAKRPGSLTPAYHTVIASRDGGRVPSDTVVSLDTEPLDHWAERDVHTLVVVGGNGANTAMHDTRLVAQVEDLAGRSRRVCSVCSGALILAAAGILDGRRATTHWEDCAHLAHDFPRVDVETDPIYVKDGHVWTSAGITAGIDMALAVIAEDLGQAAALELAQSLVTYMVRPGGQSQFSPALERQKLDRSARFDALHRWIADNLKGDLRVDRLAEREHMSLRSFHRLYTSAMEMTPAKAVETIRMEAARELLETTGLGIKSVAERCGFGDEERMRRAFIRMTGIAPSAYRQRFSIRAET